MAIPEGTPYVYDQVISLYGAQVGKDLRYIVTNGGTVDYAFWTNLSSCYTFHYSSEYCPGVNACEGIKSTVPAQDLSMCCKAHNFGSLGAIICADQTGQAYYDINSRLYVNIAQEKTILTGAIRNWTASTLWVPAARVIVGGFDLSHYFLIPSVVARKPLTTQTITCDWKTYKAQYMADYPHIISITCGIAYKPDLTSESAASWTNICVCGSQRYYNGVMGNFDSRVMVNDYSTSFTTQNMAAIGTTLYAPPGVDEVYIRYSMGGSSTVYVNSLRMLPGLQSTHGPGIQKLAFLNPEGGAPGNTPRNPYVYIDPGTAQSIINSMGFWVADSLDDTADAHGSETTSDNVSMPEIDSNGIPTGTMWTGGGGTIESSPINQNWQSQQNIFPTGNGVDSIAAVSIDLTKPVNRTDQTNTRPVQFGTPELLPQTPTINGLGVFANYYALSANGILALSDFLWNGDEEIIVDIINSLKLFGQNPINAIMSLRLYPFNIAALLPSVVAEEIVLGRVSTGVAGLKIPNNAGTTINLGSLYIDGHFNDFRDYAPYTSYNLYIPFVGTVNLNPNDYLYHIVDLKMVVDITTGKATAIIYADGIPIQYLDGMVGVEVPITGENMGQTVNAIISAVGSTAAAAITTGGVGAAMAAVAGAADIVFNDVSINKQGNISPAASLSLPINAYLIISRPNAIIPENYGRSKGYACDKTAAISGLKGFTVCYNVDTSGITATESEREQIKTLLETGVYL